MDSEQQRERLGGPSHVIGRLATGSSRSLSLARGVRAVGIDRRRSSSSARRRDTFRRTTQHPPRASSVEDQAGIADAEKDSLEEREVAVAVAIASLDIVI